MNNRIRQVLLLLLVLSFAMLPVLQASALMAAEDHGKRSVQPEARVPLDQKEKEFYKDVYGTEDEDAITELIGQEGKRSGSATGRYERFEIEPNDTPRQADWTFSGSDAYGRIQSADDVDYWKIRAPGNGTLQVKLDQIPAGQDYNLYLYDSEQKELGRSERKGSADERIDGIRVKQEQWYYIAVRGAGGSFSKKDYYHLMADFVPEGSRIVPDKYEPNNSLADAVEIQPNSVLRANIHDKDDIDYFKLQVPLASTIELLLTGMPTGVDLDLYLLDKDGRQIAQSEYAKNLNESITYNGDPGTYYIKIKMDKRSELADHEYQLSVTVHTIPVILVPGIGGSRLLANERGKTSEAWLNFTAMLGPKDSEHRRLLALTPQSPGSVKMVPKNNGIQILPEAEDDGLRGISYLSYHSLVKKEAEQYNSMAEHLQKMGYKKGESLFGFPYDWRMSSADNAGSLLRKIDEAIAKSKAKQVQLVVHSMGGLVTKEALLQNTQYQHKTKRIIYMGTPFLGSPRAYQAIKMGYTFGIGIKITENNSISLFSADAGKAIAEYAPAVYELLPSREYVKKQGYLNLIGVNVQRPYTYDETLTDPRIRLTYRPLAEQSDRLHQKWDQAQLNVQQYAIIGDGQKTLLGYDFEQASQRFIPFYGVAGGDGTVPLVSAAYSKSDVAKKYYVQEEHAKLPVNRSVIQQVARLLSGKEEVQPGIRLASEKTKSFDYLVIYRQDGEFPEVTLSQAGEELVITKKGIEQTQENSFQVEVHGDTLVVFEDKERGSLQVKQKQQIRTLSSVNSGLVVKRYQARTE
ncbi:lipase/acyltransferase domain-containing protein [Brevibacillus sp. B_LB10_24]|uniref:lipase/acyltransferase domain-containing protein n=1 Tax=Brevibacillus sp. B_LB10_24 TaxID=3380645 RepID=UPI0038BBF7FA